MFLAPPSRRILLRRHFHSTRPWYDANTPQPKPKPPTSSSNHDPAAAHAEETHASEEHSSPPRLDRSPPSPGLAQSKIQQALVATRHHLREWSEQAAIQARLRADDFTASTKKTFAQLGAELNKVTGYEEIEVLKRRVVDQERQIEAVRRAAREAKLDYQQAVLKRSESQREVNDLLQRKSSWTDNDVLRFTRLVREDHSLEQAEARAKCAVNDCDHAVDTEFSELTRSILARYHEEQVWSDKIRSAATYGQLAVLALNVFVFVLATVAVEPWKRRRLARTFERKVEQLGAQTEERIDAAAGDLSERLGAQEHALMEVTRVLAETRVAFAEPQPSGTMGSPLPPESIAQPTFFIDRALHAGNISPSVAISSTAVAAVLLGWFARAWTGN